MGVCTGVQAFTLRGSGRLDLAGRAGSGGGADGDDAPGGVGIYVTSLFTNQKWVSCSCRRSQRCIVSRGAVEMAMPQDFGRQDVFIVVRMYSYMKV